MHTKDIMAAELEKAGLHDMAVKARRGYYHDFLSPLVTPCLVFAADLQAVGTPAALALRERHLNGEFDATAEESEEWASGTEGQDAMMRLLEEGEVRDTYLIWSNEHRAWWGPGESGYVRKVSRAGHYSREAAVAICQRALGTAAHIGVLSELPVRAADVEAFIGDSMVPRWLR